MKKHQRDKQGNALKFFETGMSKTDKINHKTMIEDQLNAMEFSVIYSADNGEIMRSSGVSWLDHVELYNLMA